MKGKVFLVGAGPGDPELLTVKAVKVLQVADVVLHDDLISAEILGLISPTAQVRNVGKRCGRKSTSQEEINAQLIAFASFGLTVVRLKSGDPLIFGRAGEEMDALCKGNVDFEIIPGVTSALASAAAAEVPLTHRRSASAVLLLSGHLAEHRVESDWKAYASCGATLAVYMPGSDYRSTAERLIAAGMNDQTPCVIVSRASSPEQRIHHTTIQNLYLAPILPAPTMLLVGEVVGGNETEIVNEDSAVWFAQAEGFRGQAGAWLEKQDQLSQLGANL